MYVPFTDLPLKDVSKLSCFREGEAWGAFKVLMQSGLHSEFQGSYGYSGDTVSKEKQRTTDQKRGKKLT